MTTSLNTLSTSLSGIWRRVEADPSTAPGALRRALLAGWNALETIGPRRSRRELLVLARAHDATRPGLAGNLRAMAGASWL